VTLKKALVLSAEQVNRGCGGGCLPASLLKNIHSLNTNTVSVRIRAIPAAAAACDSGVVEGNDRCVAVSNKGSRASFGVCGVLMQL